MTLFVLYVLAGMVKKWFTQMTWVRVRPEERRN